MAQVVGVAVALTALVIGASAAVDSPMASWTGGRPTVPWTTGDNPGPNLSLSIDPASWWMESGTSAGFDAAWVGTPAGCTVLPAWYRWSIAGGGTAGALNSTNSSRTTFVAASGGSGDTVLTVRGAATLECGTTAWASFSRASAQVTVSAPLVLSDLTLAPAPVAPGVTTHLLGTLDGGSGPYGLVVSWGDGTSSTSSVAGPGPFSLPHDYVEPGSFSPVVTVTDAAGRTATGAPEESLTVSREFAVAIIPSTLVAEVGVPVAFDLETLNAPSNYSWVFVCQDGDGAVLPGPPGPEYACVFATPGVAPVTFEGVGANSPYSIASSVLWEDVTLPPTAGFPGSPSTTEAGSWTYVPLDVNGGVPPFNVTWSVVGTGANGSLNVPADGDTYLALRSTVVGALLLSVTVLDALGARSPPVEDELDVLPTLVAWANLRSASGTSSEALNVSGSVAEGAPPFDWTVVPGSTPLNSTPGSGLLVGPGTFDWNATSRAEGTLRVSVVVVDGDGAVAVLNLTVALVAHVNISAGVDPIAPGLVDLRLTVTGGAPPFSYRWVDGGGEAWNGSLTDDGTAEVREHTAFSGNCSFQVSVVDAWGVSDHSRIDGIIVVPTQAAVAGPVVDDATLWTMGAALAVGALGLSIFLLRRRRPGEVPAPPDPVTVLREAIEPSDGVDRGLVEMLAEERGVPLELARATLQRLKAEGAVRSGRGSDGEEVLAWVDSPPR